MHKYKVGQMVELVAHAEWTGDPLIGTVSVITGHAGFWRDIPSYTLECLSPGEKITEEALRPINPPAMGSWTEIAALLGTDIRRLREHAE